MMEQVKLTLVDLSCNIGNGKSDDESTEELKELLEKVLRSCTTAQDCLALRHENDRTPSRCCRTFMQSSPTHIDAKEHVKERLKNDVLRYMKCSDKYSALTSLLLKSGAFHLTYPTTASREEEGGAMPVVELPRTIYGRPFIPDPHVINENGGNSPAGTEGRAYPFSVSHQFPFVGIARLEMPGSHSNGNNDGSHSTGTDVLKVGLDIVVFEKHNEKLYNTTQDFVDVFKDSFTEWEWNRINEFGSDDNLLLNEFYVRWAIKESYTKALGMGVGIDFSSFETRFHSVDNGGLWQAVTERKGGTVLRGIVTCDQTKVERIDIFDFFFQSLQNSAGEFLGCLALCIGPLQEGDSPSLPPVVELSSLNELVMWHGEQKYPYTP